MLNTPWGVAQSVRQLAEGVLEVSTAGHGGIMVRYDVAETKLSRKARTLNRYGGTYGDFECYDEDIEWALPLYEHPEWDTPNWSWRHPDLTPEQAAECVKAEAEEALRAWLPEYFQQETGLS